MGFSQIVVAALDVVGTHKDDKGIPCPMRIAQHPGDFWYCIDCGRAIRTVRISVDTEGGALESDPDAPAAHWKGDVTIPVTLSREEWQEVANAITGKRAYMRLTAALDEEGVVY
jgi:flagellar basal body rod protein FlgC